MGKRSKKRVLGRGLSVLLGDVEKNTFNEKAQNISIVWSCKQWSGRIAQSLKLSTISIIRRILLVIPWFNSIIEKLVDHTKSISK